MGLASSFRTEGTPALIPGESRDVQPCPPDALHHQILINFNKEINKL